MDEIYRFHYMAAFLKNKIILHQISNMYILSWYQAMFALLLAKKVNYSVSDFPDRHMWSWSAVLLRDLSAVDVRRKYID